MKIATVTETKNRLSALLKLVRAGETVVVVDRGIPVARIEPAVTGEPDGRIARLEREGVIRRATSAPPVELIATPPPRATDGVSVLEALIEERRSGR